MNTQTSYTITSVLISASVFAVMLLSTFTMVADAAPYQNYFTDTESDTSFMDWLNDQEDTTLASCDTFNTVFSQNCGSRESKDNSDMLAAVGAAFSEDGQDADSNQTGNDAQDETEAVAVSINDQRCVDEDGVVEFDFENVDSYELTIDGDIYEVADISNKEVNFKTFADLADGSYVMAAYNAGEDDSVSFTVDCDGETVDPGSLTASCNVTPSDPEIDKTVTWSVQANGGSGSYSYEWTGDVSGYSSSVETSYSTPGEKEAFAAIESGTEFLTTRCAVDVQGEEVDEEATPQARTIEEF